ncbi:hypothetical protein DYB34_003786 [Aphanomyces astaci]|uniref:DNA-(apurinic or apyrimidinic site) endonuclease n=1 Tax=Aphanomyces astaci TaxID=112090 RepID=A0A3R6ZV65_APHAT|nr:hypothetical protein DYB34_003786 [Aphanomyces astaci]
MHILTWNINGLRAILTKANQSVDEFLAACDADIICLQETKLTRSEMTEALACPTLFDAFFSFSRFKKGYSGVVTFVRSSAVQTLDADTTSCVFQEGRVVLTVHPQCLVVNAYCPTTAGNMERKMQFLDSLLLQLDRWRTSHPDKPLIFVGDFNVIHQSIDHSADHIPTEATTWLDALVAKAGDDSKQQYQLVDAFRHFHPDDHTAYTCWSQLTGGRETNYGVRLDYILLDKRLLSLAIDCWLWADKVGSDHCPVVLDIDTSNSTGAPTTAPACAKFFPEFAGTQQSLRGFLSRQPSSHIDVSSPQPPPARPPPALRQPSIASFFCTPKHPPTRKVDRPNDLAAQDDSIMLPLSSPGTLNASNSNAVLGRESITHLDEYQSVAASWKSLLPGKAPPPPLCSGHKLPCVLRTVLKHNDNWGRKFYLCCRPEGATGDPTGRCDFFQWVVPPSKKRKAVD